MFARKPFTHIAALLLAMVGIAHGYRLWAGCRVMIDTVAVPMWVSWIGLFVALLLSWMLVREARR